MNLTRTKNLNRRLFALTLGTALTASLVTGCSNSGDRVVVIGDSITLTSGGPLAESLAEFDSTIAARLGATVNDMLPRARELAATNPQQVVIDLGTNDVNHGTPTEETRRALEEMVGLFPEADCIYLVDINTHMAEGGTPSGPAAQAVNEVISDLADEHGNVEIIKWDRLVENDLEEHGGTSTLLRDTVHPTEAGQQALAEEMADAFDKCGFPLAL